MYQNSPKLRKRRHYRINFTYLEKGIVDAPT